MRALPDGLDTVVGDRGYRLSGGERQRLAIARLLLKAPPIVVLDEATAHLDSESEVAVQRALDQALEGRTSLVIAHRLSTVRNADLILVVDDGRIVQRGTHAALLAEGGLYADLYRPSSRSAPPDGSSPARAVARVAPWISDSPTACTSSPEAPAASGRATAEALVAEGARVVLSGRAPGDARRGGRRARRGPGDRRGRRQRRPGTPARLVDGRPRRRGAGSTGR